jgi:RsiW-degrading membrane proteinase PrsW (M82 family)
VANATLRTQEAAPSPAQSAPASPAPRLDLSRLQLPGDITLLKPQQIQFPELQPVPIPESKKSWWTMMLQYPLLVFVLLRLIALAFQAPVRRQGVAEKVHDKHGKARPDAAVNAATKRHHSRLRWILFAGFAVLLGVSVLFQIQAEVGKTVLFNAIMLSILPLPIWIVLTQWIHRFKAEPTRMLAAAFLWGATVACFFSLRANVSFAQWVAQNYGKDAIALGAVLSAPWVEEGLKGAFVLFLFFWPSAKFDDVIDGIVYASMVGLGFAMMENILYFGKAIQTGGGLVSKMFLVRQVMGPFIHPFFTCMFGIGLGFSRETDNRAVKFVAPIAGFFLAMFLHYTWNLTGLFDGLLELAVANGILARPVPFYFYFYFLFMFPGFVAVITLILFQLGREGTIIGVQLLPEVRSGVLSGDDLKRLSTVRGRMRAGFDAFSRRGFKPWLVQRKFQQIASELAFHRYRVAHGMSQRDEALESAFVEHLHRFLPPPLPAKVQTQPV